MAEDTQIDRRDSIMTACKALYCKHNSPASETCMCWGLDVPDAWLDCVEDLSMKLEAANVMLHSKYRVRVQADQVKSKYATLHFYYSIAIDPPAWICLYEKLVESAMSWLSTLDYKLKTVVDREAFDEDVVEEISASEYDAALKSGVHASNVEFLAQADGKFIKKTVLHHWKQSHREPTKHKLLHRLLSRKPWIKRLLRAVAGWKPSDAQLCVAKLLDSFAKREINEAVQSCMERCEVCGKHIYDDEEHSPRCTTLGWMSYLCKDCADKSGIEYVCNGKVWRNGKVTGKAKASTIEL